MLTGVPDELFASHDEIEKDIGVLPSLLFPCVNGRAVMWGRPCFESGENWSGVSTLRRHIESGRVASLGELVPQFVGLSPSDPAMEPFYALAEEYDLPVFIHMGPGLPGTNFGRRYGDFPVPDYSAAAGNPLSLEGALQNYPDMRLVVMHAVWPLADEMIFILHQDPQVYAGIGL